MGAGDVEVNITNLNAKPCAVFDGVDDIINMGNINGSLTTFSFSLWFKSSDIVTVQAAITKHVDATNRFEFTISAKDLFVTVSNGSSSQDASTTGDKLTVNTWQNLTGTFDGGTVRCYIDGVIGANTGSVSNGLIPASGDMHIGDRASDGGRNIKGSISDIKMWDRALTQAEVTTVFNGGNVTDGLIHRWTLNSNSNDSVGSDNGSDSGLYYAIQDDAVAAAIAADYTTANDNYLLTDSGKQIISAIVEEA